MVTNYWIYPNKGAETMDEHILKKINERILEKIKAGEKFSKIQEESYMYIGHSSYEHIDYHITPAGQAAGWEYRYPCLKFNGRMYLDAGMTIEQGLLDGHLETDIRVSTLL
jgi:hypothetical protein